MRKTILILEDDVDLAEGIEIIFAMRRIEFYNMFYNCRRKKDYT